MKDAVDHAALEEQYAAKQGARLLSFFNKSAQQAYGWPCFFFFFSLTANSFKNRQYILLISFNSSEIQHGPILKGLVDA